MEDNTQTRLTEQQTPAETIKPNDSCFEEPWGGTVYEPSTRRVIGSGKPINGGAYPDLRGGAIVVDDGAVKADRKSKLDPEKQQRYEAALTPLVRQLNQRLDDRYSGDMVGRNAAFLKEVMDFAKFNIPHDPKRVQDSREEPDSSKVQHLSSFISNRSREGGGEVIHQTLLAAYLLEQNGKNVSVERNAVPEKGGHSWLKITDPKTGKVSIMDLAFEFVGSVEEASRTIDWQYPVESAAAQPTEGGGSVLNRLFQGIRGRLS